MPDVVQHSEVHYHTKLNEVGEDKGVLFIEGSWRLLVSCSEGD